MLRLAQEWTYTQGSLKQKVNQTERLPKNPQIRPDQIAKMTCKTGAAWNKLSKKAGLAWIFTESSRSCKHKGATTQDFVTSPLISEALALRSGIITAADMGISDLQMLSDNLTFVRVINNGNSEIYDIVKDIQQISSAFVDITFSHVSVHSIVKLMR